MSSDTSNKMEVLKRLLQSFDNVERVDADLDFLPTPEMIVLNVIAVIAKQKPIDFDIIYENRVITPTNNANLEEIWRESNPKWYHQLNQIYSDQGLLRYCQLLTNLATNVFEYSQKLGAKNKVIILALDKGLIERPVPLKRIKAMLELVAGNLTDIAREGLQQLLSSEAIPSPPREEADERPKKPKKPKEPKEPKEPKVRKVPKVVPTKEPQEPTVSTIDLDQMIADIEQMSIEELRSDHPTKSSATGPEDTDSAFKADHFGQPSTSFSEEPVPAIEQIIIENTRVELPDHRDITRVLAKYRAIERQDQTRPRGKQAPPMEFRFLPDCYEILQSCCDWEYVIKGMVVDLIDRERMEIIWKRTQPEWAKDVKQLNSMAGQQRYALQLLDLLDAIQAMREPHTISNAIYTIQVEGRLMRSPDMVADMLAMDHEQIALILRSVVRAAKMDK